MNKRIGIIGGGQLGKMLIEQNNNQAEIDKTQFFVYSEDKPLTDLPHTWINGKLNDMNGIIKFGIENCDIITYEIENICVDALDILKKNGKLVYPDPEILRLVQNKKLQKEYFVKNNYPTAPFTSYNVLSEVNQINFPCVNKLQIGGYDGRGVRIIQNKEQQLFEEPSIIEEYIKIDQEISIIVARNYLGKVFIFPTVEMFFNNDHMLDYLTCPAFISMCLDQQIISLAEKLANDLNLIGIMAIEFFVNNYTNLYINEISPRAHNSGHHTIDSMPNQNQFNLWYQCLMHKNDAFDSLAPYKSYNPINYDGKLITLMINLLGSNTDKPISTNVNLTSFFSSKFNLHLYNKPMSFTNRKMGHLTYVMNYPDPPALYIDDDDYYSLESHKYDNYTYEKIMENIIHMKHAIIIGSPNNQVYKNPIISIIMGSISDMEIIKPCIQILKEFKVEYSVKIVSAHRTPVDMIKYGQEIADTTIKVIIAAAGGSAHLPGMIASVTTLPVIGIPIKSHNSINGIDSLLSIVQMPAGIPVGTMAIDGAKNAGLYAIRMLAISDERLKILMKIYQKCLEENVNDMNTKLLNL